MTYTYREKFNRYYGFSKGCSHTIAEIGRLTRYRLAGLKTVYNKGLGAYYSNPTSVRSSVKSARQWAQARLYSAVMGGKAARIDAKHLVRY